MDRTQPNGRVIGLDIIPAQPPRGVSTVQGNFLCVKVQSELKKLLRDQDRGRVKHTVSSSADFGIGNSAEEYLEEQTRSYLEVEKRTNKITPRSAIDTVRRSPGSITETYEKNLVDVVLSDMCGPFAQDFGPWSKRCLINPYYRMMNTSGVSFRDHAGSMVCDR